MNLTEEHRAALASYAREHGRNWKDALALDWYRARLTPCADMPARGSLLHEPRNAPGFGPDGLRTIKTKDLTK